MRVTQAIGTERHLNPTTLPQCRLPTPPSPREARQGARRLAVPQGSTTDGETRYAGARVTRQGIPVRRPGTLVTLYAFSLRFGTRMARLGGVQI